MLVFYGEVCLFLLGSCVVGLELRKSCCEEIFLVL